MDYTKLAAQILQGGDGHSQEYTDGLIAALKLRIETEVTRCPHAEGSVQFDAYYFGCSRGANEWSNALLGKTRAEAIAYFRQLATLNSDLRAA